MSGSTQECCCGIAKPCCICKIDLGRVLVHVFLWSVCLLEFQGQTNIKSSYLFLTMFNKQLDGTKTLRVMSAFRQQCVRHGEIGSDQQLPSLLHTHHPLALGD